MHHCVRQTHDSPPSEAGSGARGTPNRSFAVPSCELRTKTEIVIVITSPVGGKAPGVGGGVPSQTQQGREVCVQSTHQAGGRGWVLVAWAFGCAGLGTRLATHPLSQQLSCQSVPGNDGGHLPGEGELGASGSPPR